jgi:hypothetical protein
MTDESHRNLERLAHRVPVPEPAYDRLLRRRDRRERNRRISAGALAIIVALVSFVALTRALYNGPRPAHERTAKPPGIFSEVGGWIVYGNERGIWAVDPTRPDDPNSQIRLSTDGATPLAWSSDGSKLLILRQNTGLSARRRLFVLNADGTETHLATTEDIPYPGGGWESPDIGGSFSPDGSQVVYAERSSIYVVDAQGGTPRVLQTASRRWFSVNGIRIRALVHNPTYSPDGTQIAYFDGAGPSTEEIARQLRVMNSDGSGTRVVVDDLKADGINNDGIYNNPPDRIYNLAWSPDGKRLAFGLGSGIYIVGADGSGLTLAIPDGAYPYWSPDSTRIAFANLGDNPGEPCADRRCYATLDTLQIAALDGMHVQEFGYAEPGPWNPVGQPEQEVAEVPAASGGATFDAQLVWAAAVLLGLGAAFVVAIRRRKRGAAEPG